MPTVYIAICLGIAAIWDDLARRRISNWIPAIAFLSGLCLQFSLHGWYGALAALLGALTGASVFILFYLLGGMGGGDIKLMAGFGAMLGTNRILEAALWTAGSGGLIAGGVILVSAVRRRGADKSRTLDSIPYAPAITAGVWLSLINGR